MIVAKRGIMMYTADESGSNPPTGALPSTPFSTSIGCNHQHCRDTGGPEVDPAQSRGLLVSGLRFKMQLLA